MSDQQTTVELVRKLESAVNSHNVNAFAALCTDDIVWETTTPPDGDRYEGIVAVRAAGEAFFKESPNATFETEELTASGDSAVLRWRYTWENADGTSGHVRGVDLLRTRDGKISEMLSYVKG
jgi:ketosteroid isomerase-like protein